MLISVKDNFLQLEDLEFLRAYAIENVNTILKDESLTLWFWRKYREKLLEINSRWVGLYPDVTITNSSKPIGKHQDRTTITQAREKLLIYLNEVPNGGTVFFVDGEEVLIQNKVNRLVCFDIQLYHQSENFKVEGQLVNKLAIGFRPVTSF